MSEGVEYLVRLKYIKRASLPVLREQKLAEFLPVFQTVTERGVKKVPGKVEVRTRVYLPEFLDFAKRVGFEIDARESLLKWLNLPPSKRTRLEMNTRGVTLRTTDDNSYLRLMIYGVVMAYLKSPSEWDSLADRVLSMEPIELRFWASKFRNAYWKYKNRRILNYLAKRFMEVEGI